MRQESNGLPRNRRPGRAAIGRSVNARPGHIRYASVYGLSGVPRRAGPLVECHPIDSLIVVEVMVGVGGVFGISPGVGKAVDLRPGRARIGALPEAVPAGSAEVKDVV